MLSMTSGKNKTEFHYGKKRRSVFDFVKVGLLLKVPLDVISSIPGVEKKKVFNAVDKLQQKLGIDMLNDYIIQDEELLKYRIERTLDESVEDYERNL
jgi:hypothetical protein